MLLKIIDGVYSGSALVENNKIHYYYTGNVKYTDKKNMTIFLKRQGTECLLKSFQKMVSIYEK